MGAQSWFPSNNYPSDKATFETLITVPAAKTALGVGELAAKTDNGDGTSTWHWTEDDPTATYLTTATVGDFIYDEDSMVETSTGRTLPVYNAIDSSASPAQLTAINTSLAQAPDQINFLSGLYGPYPFDSTGAVADRASGVGYALEVQTKPHYSGGFSSGNPSINAGTQLHELAHQWFGNSATLERWSDIWFQEGFANWSEWYWDFVENGGADPAVIWADLYATTPDGDWALAPAVLGGDPANLFAFFPTYERGAMTIEGFREILERRHRVLRLREVDPGAVRPRQHQHRGVHRRGEGRLRVQRRAAHPAGRLLPAVAVRDREADDHAGGLRPLSARLGPAAVSRAPVRAPARSSARGRRPRSRRRPR